MLRVSDALRAVWHLVIARVTLKRVIRTRPDFFDEPDRAYVGSLELVQRVTFMLPRVASRLPWRADCLVQALAAKYWLTKHGVPVQIILGTRLENEPFEAHAWTTVNNRVVTGGEIAGYKRFGPV